MSGMQLNLDLIYKIVTSLFLVFIVGKILGTIFSSFSGRGNSSSKDQDIDMMVERQKNMLRVQLGLEANPTATAKTTNKINKTKEKYTIASADSKHENHQDYLEILKMIEEVQWGGGGQFAEIAKLLFDKWNIQIDSTIVCQNLQGLLNRDFLLRSKSNNLPNKKEVHAILALRTFLGIVTDELTSGNIDLLENISNHLNLDLWTVKKSIEISILERLGHGFAATLEKVLTNEKTFKEATPGKRSDAIIECLITEDNEHFCSIDLFLSRVKRHAAIVSSLKILPELSNNNDRQTALRIFGLKDDCDQEVIKKTYKALAASLHPDKLEGKGISSNLIKRANENFGKLQMAYDILKKDG